MAPILGPVDDPTSEAGALDLPAVGGDLWRRNSSASRDTKQHIGSDSQGFTRISKVSRVHGGV